MVTLTTKVSRLIESRLAGDEFADRLVHSYGVAETMSDMAGEVFGPTGLTVEQQKWYWCLGALHDIGYAFPITGFHSLDGAQFVSQFPELRSFVPHIFWHSTAEWEFEVAGAKVMTNVVKPSVFDHALLWVADFTTGPQGQAMTIAERVAEIAERHSPQSRQFRSAVGAIPSLIRAQKLIDNSIRLSKEKRGQ